MSSVFRPSTIDDKEQIIDLLTRVFSVGRDASFVNPELLQWKYWEFRTDCADPRSFVIEKDGRIVAHAGLWPVTVRNGAGSERGVHMIDWAADPQSPGAGVSLLQRLTTMYDFVYSIGGSEMTRAILGKFGFRVSTESLTFARPIRPWRQILQHQRRNVGLPFRLARNAWWSRTPGRASISGWAAIEAAADEVAGLSALTGGRDGSFLRYLQQCPSVRMLVFHILRDGRKSGFFALAVVRKQTRLAGVWLEDPAPGNLRIAFQLAQDAALRHTATSELIARTAAKGGALAATQSGMRLRRQSPVFLFRKGQANEAPPLQFQLWDNDGLFLDSGGSDFLT